MYVEVGEKSKVHFTKLVEICVHPVRGISGHACTLYMYMYLVSTGEFPEVSHGICQLSLQLFSKLCFVTHSREIMAKGGLGKGGEIKGGEMKGVPI